MRLHVPLFSKIISEMDNVNLKHGYLYSIFQKAVAAVKPSTLIQNSVKIHGDNLVIKGESYSLKKPCYVVGFGKAVLDMAVSLEALLGNRLREGIVTVPTGIFKYTPKLPTTSKIRFIEGASNNLPDEAAERGARQIKNLAEKLQETDLLIVIISGGGSALLPLPRPPATLSQKLTVVRRLAAAGADIQELNCVRKRLSQLKGGGLALLAHPAEVVAIILSDIVGDPLVSIASGPTAPSADSPDAAVKIMEKYSLYDELPHPVKQLLKNQSGAAAPAANFNHVHNYIIGNNETAALAALKEAAALGYEGVILSREVCGDVGSIAKIYAELARQLALQICTKGADKGLKMFLQGIRSDLKVGESAFHQLINLDFGSSKGVCIVLAGEPTVAVTGTGKGGRNQQLALAFSVEINNLPIDNADVSFLSCGTDGMDGPTDAAGAIGDSGLVKKALAENMDPFAFLSNNDSYSFYSAFDSGRCLIRTGHTGTNVMDVHVLIVSPKLR